MNSQHVDYYGQGYYPSILPLVIKRNVLENPKWYTPYTPYQAEISQGRLEMLLNYQTMIVELTGLDYANASLLDESSSAAEAMAMSHSVHNGKRNKFFVSKTLFPQSIDVCKTRADAMGVELTIGKVADFPWDNATEYCGAIFQSPDNLGNMENYSELFARFKANGIISILAQDIASQTICKPAGEMGADIAVGSAQRFGLPMAFGGPHPGYMACKDEFKRKMPGRIIGVSRDRHGNMAYRMSLQTREQHIRRDKATSNICTAQNLLSNMTALYGIWHGPEGLKTISTRIRFYTQMLMTALEDLDIKVITDKNNFFDTLVFEVKASGFSSADKVVADFHRYGINLRKLDDNHVGISINETTVVLKLATLIEIFALLKEKKDLGESFLDDDFFTIQKYHDLHSGLKRTSSFMQQPVFNELTSESEFMRYIHRLADKDYSLVHGMIPLGSCTMKLNSAAVMTPITFPGLANIHPFAPAEQIKGYIAMIKELETQLMCITHYDSISLQPNSGASGEYAGLIAIKKYHESLGDFKRNLVLIPTSAHGTNPATATMIGMKVVPIAVTHEGKVDVNDLKEKCAKYSDRISAAMITYPSTYGIFEDEIKEVC